MEENERILEIQKVITEHTSATMTNMAEISLSDIPRLAEEIHKLYYPVKNKFITDFEYEFPEKKSYSFDYVDNVTVNADGHRVGSLHTEYITAYDEKHASLIFENLHPDTDYDKPY